MKTKRAVPPVIMLAITISGKVSMAQTEYECPATIKKIAIALK
jgi:hypothetical protein